MIGKFLGASALIIAIAAVYVLLQGRPQAPAVTGTTPPEATRDPLPTDLPDAAVTVGAATYRFRLTVVPASAPVILLPDFGKKLTASAIVGTEHCSAAINGGFYTKDYTPLGMWDDGRNDRFPAIRSALVNAFVMKEKSGGMRIVSDAPAEGTYAFAFQTGPRLMEDGQALSLTIANDEQARRSVLATTKDGRTVLLSIFGETSMYGGPMLADLPRVVFAISGHEGPAFTDAVNLDGGSASFFWDGERMIDELTTVGSAVCVK